MMKGQIIRGKIFKILIVDLYLLLLFLKLQNIWNGIDRTRIILLIGMYFLLAINLMKNLFQNQLKIAPIYGIFILYALYVIIRLAFTNSLQYETMLSFLFFPSIFLLFYERPMEEQENTKTVEIIAWLQLILEATFFIVFMQQQIFSGMTDRSRINTVYYVVTTMPMVLLSKRKFVRILSIVMAAIAAVMSLKLGACVVVLVMTVSIFADLDKNGIKKVWKLLLIVGSLIVLAVIVQNQFGIDIFAKIRDSNSTGGSGRFELWQLTWSNIWESNFTELLFGHIESSSTQIVLNHSSHNDFLEALWRLGIIGFTLLLSILVNIGMVIFRASKKSKRKNILIGIYISMLFLLFFSQLIFIPSYIGLLTMALTSILSNINERKDIST